MIDISQELLSDLIVAGVIVVVSIVLAALARIFLERIVHRLTSKTKTELDDIIIAAIKTPVRLGILILGLQLALEQIRETPPDLLQAEKSLFFFLNLLLVYIIVYRVIGGIMGWISGGVSRKPDAGINQSFLSLIRRTVLTIVSVIFGIILLGQFGIEVGGLIASLGIGSLALALAAQETLSDMISGFVIMIDQPFKVSDRIEIQEIDTWGDVKEIGLRSTRILTRDNRMVAVPNSIIGKGLVINYSVPNTIYRVQTHVGIAYGSDVDQARKVMIEAIRAQDWVMKNKPVEALLLEFGASSLDFRVRCWIEHFVETRRVIDKMNTALYHALQRENILIPFPQRDLHLVSSKVTPFDVRLNDASQN